MKPIRSIFAAALVCVLSLPVAAAEKSYRDVSYGTDNDQKIDIYMPSEGRKNAPVMVMVHGGAWATGDKSNDNVVKNKIAHYVPQGYIFVSVNYRLVPEVYPVDQANDVALALKYVQNKMREWGSSPGNMVVMGHSAGAHLAALISADIDDYGLTPWRATVVLDSGALDLEEVMRDDPSSLYRNAFGTDSSYWRAASPEAQLDSGMPPYLLVCSSKRATQCEQANDFASEVRAHGGSAQVLPVALAHAQINKKLGQNNSYTDAVDDFLEARNLP